MNWVVPHGDKRTVQYSEQEWKTKGKTIVSLCKNKHTAVQAGGNIGIFPYYLANYFDEVHTFEPIKKNFDCLIENTKGIHNIVSFNHGLGDKFACAEIKRESAGNCGAIRLQYSKSPPKNKLSIIPLDSCGLDALDLLWLDVEGFEVKALKGAMVHIEEFKPVIVLENNGLIHEFPGELEGSKELRIWMRYTFGYKLHSRLMRDDIYIPA